MPSSSSSFHTHGDDTIEINISPHSEPGRWYMQVASDLVSVVLHLTGDQLEQIGEAITGWSCKPSAVVQNNGTQTQAASGSVDGGNK